MVLDGYHGPGDYVLEGQCPGKDFPPTCLSLSIREEAISRSALPFCTRMVEVVHGLGLRAVGRLWWRWALPSNRQEQEVVVDSWLVLSLAILCTSSLPFHLCGGCKFMMDVLTGLVSSETSLIGLWLAISFSVLTWSLLSVCTPGASLSLQICSLCRCHWSIMAELELPQFHTHS